MEEIKNIYLQQDKTRHHKREPRSQPPESGATFNPNYHWGILPVLSGIAVIIQLTYNLRRLLPVTVGEEEEITRNHKITIISPKSPKMNRKSPLYFEIISWRFGYRPQYQPSTIISPQAKALG